MRAEPLEPIPDVLLLQPRVHRDDRGFFVERWSRAALYDLGVPDPVQENHSRSKRFTLRGLHFQEPPHAQGKLVGVLQGRVFDVAVDLRRGSATYGRWVGATLTGRRPQVLWIPPGFAHGFLALSRSADVVYAVTAPYAADADGGIAWDDPDLGVTWPLPPGVQPRLSPRDAGLPRLAQIASPFVG